MLCVLWWAGNEWGWYAGLTCIHKQIVFWASNAKWNLKGNAGEQSFILNKRARKYSRLNHRKSFILQISILILHLTGDWVEIYKTLCSYRTWTSLNLSPEKVSFFPIIQAHLGLASIFFSSTISPHSQQQCRFCVSLFYFGFVCLFSGYYHKLLGLAWLDLAWLGFFRLWCILDSRNDFYTQLRCACVVTYQDGG